MTKPPAKKRPRTQVEAMIPISAIATTGHAGPSTSSTSATQIGSIIPTSSARIPPAAATTVRGQMVPITSFAQQYIEEPRTGPEPGSANVQNTLQIPVMKTSIRENGRGTANRDTVLNIATGLTTPSLPPPNLTAETHSGIAGDATLMQDTPGIPLLDDDSMPGDQTGDVAETSEKTTTDPHSGGSAKRKARKTWAPMKEWTRHRDKYLAEFMRLEGFGENDPSICPQCQVEDADRKPLYRCNSCSSMHVVCHACAIQNHQSNGLHILEFWNGSFWTRRSLQDLGYRFQLGHTSGEMCASPDRRDHFVVIDHSGMHRISVDFCGCERAQAHCIQLLRFGWYPATTKKPKTAATFNVLRLYHLLTYQGKISCYEFHAALVRLTDNTGLKVPKTRFREFFRMSRQFRHLKMLKRAGRGNVAGSLSSLGPGSCAVVCPACPRPGVNLPPNWDSVPAERAFLYCLFLAMDANFRLKRKAVSSDAADPSLNDGIAYFVADLVYKDFVRLYGTTVTQDASTCSNHSAINNDRSVRGLAASGVGAVDCSRHEMKRPMAVGDLTKGERYVNMDFLWLWSLQFVALACLLVSYDIACQWSINLFKTRLPLYPEWANALDLESKDIKFVVPKFHLPAHIAKCRTSFSHNFTPGAGATDSESVERQWAGLNDYATSTQEMGPGARHDILDDVFADWNWRKVTLFVISLLQKLVEAVVQMVLHRVIFEEMTDTAKPVRAAKWMLEVKAFEENPKGRKNPYENRNKPMTLDAVRRTLAEQEGKGNKDGSQPFRLHEEISASQLVSMGMELEEQQYKLGTDLKEQRLHATDKQQTDMQLRINTLRRKVDGWIDVEHAYIPALRVVRKLLEDETSTVDDCPSKAPLLLPSRLLEPKKIHPTLSQSIIQACDERLYKIEWQLRCAQATDSLDDLREAIRLRATIINDKTRFRRGQHANTRSRGLIDRMNRQVSTAARSYQSAQEAIWKLGAHLKFPMYQAQYPTLNKTDIRNIDEEESEAIDIDSDGDEVGAAAVLGKRKSASGNKEKSGKGPEAHRSETRRVASWIWRSWRPGADLGEKANDGSPLDDDLHESLRIEWCKSRARAKRWEEEVALLQEEMRRVKESFTWQAAEWDKRTSDVSWDVEDGMAVNSDIPYSVDGAVVQGRMAFAREQAAQFRAMRSFCEKAWANVAGYVASEGKEPIASKDVMESLGLDEKRQDKATPVAGEEEEEEEGE